MTLPSVPGPRSEGTSLAIMQPYFLPYIGYFQLIAAVDVFVIYDNIKYTKKGWINRNRILSNGEAALISLPLKHGSDYLDVRDRELASTWSPDDLMGRISGAYRRAPYFEQTGVLLERILGFEDRNLFTFIEHSIRAVCGYVGITTDFRRSSAVAIDHGLAGEEKVLALCAAIGARRYLNPIGGTSLYSRTKFLDRGVELRFLETSPFEYRQFGGEFVPSLSILDLLMFNSVAQVAETLTSRYRLI